MKNLLLLLDTDAHASSFDQVVAHDAGADSVLAYSSVTPDNCFALVEGAIYTRAPKHKKHTAILVGGSNLEDAQAVFAAVQKQFFDSFRVSVMLDANGCNTTAAAAVATIEGAMALDGAQACVLAGTGPVGSRAAAMMALSGARVRLTSRKIERAQATCGALQEQFAAEVEPLAASDDAQTAVAIEGAGIVLAAGQTGVRLLSRVVWQGAEDLRVAADAGTCPPLGVEGMGLSDAGCEKDGVRMFGGLAIGALKLRLQRHAIGQLFESAEAVLDAGAILELARRLYRD